jgi:hypothetical protein
VSASTAANILKAERQIDEGHVNTPPSIGIVARNWHYLLPQLDEHG